MSRHPSWKDAFLTKRGSRVAETEWTVGKMLKWTTGYLTKKGDEHPRLSAEWLISNATGLTRVEIYVSFDKPLTPEELKRMHNGVVRRGRGEPLQYVTGEMPFRHIIVRCEKGVLIPRPETEILVDVAFKGIDTAKEQGWVYDDVAQRVRKQLEDEAQAENERLNELKQKARDQGIDEETIEAQMEQIKVLPQTDKIPESGPRVLEVGCGTGCIALSLASERPGTHVVTTDISEQAINLAERNRDALKLHEAVDIVPGDLASGVDPALAGTFAVFVSNPPYIPTALLPKLPEEVIGFEPSLALDGGKDGLDVFRRLIPVAEQELRDEGLFCVELFEGSLDAAAELLKERGSWDEIGTQEDLTHRPRIIYAIKREQV